MLKSALFVPPRTTEEIWSVPPPLLVTVTVCAAVDVPCVMTAKERFVDEKDTAGAVDGAAVAMPLTGMDCGEFEASSVIEITAERWPAARGVKVTVIVQPALAAYGPLQRFVMLKSPGLLPPRTTDEICR